MEKTIETLAGGFYLGCPLSPLMGALYLKALDDAVETTGLFYARFMDDWVVDNKIFLRFVVGVSAAPGHPDNRWRRWRGDPLIGGESCGWSPIRYDGPYVESVSTAVGSSLPSVMDTRKSRRRGADHG